MNARILVVCTANACRSPLAEQLLRARLGGWLPSEFSVSSAGTRVAYNHPACREAGRLLERLGLDQAGHQPRQLTRELIDDAQLVLTAERDHRAAVARLAPEARWRTFTLREAAALAEAARAAGPRGDLYRAASAHGPAERLADFVDDLNRARGLVEPTFDIADGHGSSARRHRAALQLVDEAVAGIAAGLALDRTLPQN
ncbi:low molecular weight phosphatase family protein [Cryobacterium tagatosivorans]|uniref:Low molecular weight phosphatase family protein n=1 Tax=Cryobacterium tagatosivorans TaxID=1259199 RepID=A0A4R8UGB6_9MICO|nr:low molecular weight phosphatase family protein [Cryobacterium tagatosivorans]TFB51756.1 low molecular weight phosphatase family protein [Cryobacterium tagatosivorans]